MRGRVIATVRSFVEVSRAIRVADGIEFRLDLFKRMPDPRRVRIEKVSIVTIRKVEDGGKFRGEEEERVVALEKYSRYCDYVDLEWNLQDEIFERMKCNVIESYHNFEETPDYEFLRELVENRRGEIFKVATMGKSKRDVEKIVRILSEYENVVAFLMGEDFAFTRIFSLFLGSPFMYCSVGEAAAPGQYDVFRAVKILRELGLK